MITKTLDISKTLDIKGVADNKANYFKAGKQEFYYSPSKKKIHLAELLPCGDYWIAKTWLTRSIIVKFN